MTDEAPPIIDTPDQFTRWLCAKCGKAGIDSWNKAVFDSFSWEEGEQIPDPFILGDNCQVCWAPLVVSYSTPGLAPRAIYGPDDGYGYEVEAMAIIVAKSDKAIKLEPSTHRDADWSGGCLAARAQLQ